MKNEAKTYTLILSSNEHGETHVFNMQLAEDDVALVKKVFENFNNEFKKWEHDYIIEIADETWDYIEEPERCKGCGAITNR